VTPEQPAVRLVRHPGVLRLPERVTLRVAVRPAGSTDLAGSADVARLAEPAGPAGLARPADQVGPAGLATLAEPARLAEPVVALAEGTRSVERDGRRCMVGGRPRLPVAVAGS
jgi:hypothetical protein